ncbi:family 43 glycosylhydrolase [Halanaerobium saccharolyticum]|nr:family 43 glycosylhydrolase [Halanaerobium saccharolyticum]
MEKKLFSLNRNITGNLKAHDPALVKENNKWWLFHTGKGFGIKSSQDGLNWKKEAPILEEPLAWWSDYVPHFDRDNDIWAPDLEFFNDKWWLYYSVSEFGTNNSVIGLLSADSIEEGNWKDEGLVITSSDGKKFNTIDPCIFIDAEDNPWLVFGSWFDGIKLAEIDQKTMKLKGEIHSLASRRVGDRAAGVEAPTLTYKDGYYYLFTSIDHCCRGKKSDYKIVYGRSKYIEGPYLDKNGIDLLNGGGTVLTASDEKYVGHGGQDIYNNQLLIHHAYSRKNGEYRFFIKDLKWENNWPELKETDNYFKGYYKIINSARNKIVSVEDSKTESRAKMVARNDNDFDSQKWMIYPVDSTFYRIENKNSLLYLEVQDALKTEAAVVQQWSNSSHPCQEWEITAVNNDEFKIINRNSQKALTLNEDNNLIQREDKDKKEQKWQLEWLQKKD